MEQPLNTSRIKLSNRRLVLDAVFQAGTTSRTQLSDQLSLSKPAISAALAPLLACGIVREAGESSPGPAGGRKQILLKFNPANRYIISIDLSSSSVVFSLSDLKGALRNTFQIFVNENTPADACLDLLCSGVRMLKQASGSQGEKACCIAIAAPGSFSQDGRLLSCNKKCGCPPWYELDLKAGLWEAFQLPVLLYNNIKAAALGEYVAGSCQQHPNMLFVSTGLGLGLGILLNGQIFLGEDCSSGEVYDYMEPGCQGKNFEALTCLDYLRSCCRALPRFENRTTLPLSDIVEAYNQKDPQVEEILKTISGRLARMVYNCLNFISLHTVCFAGEYTPFFDSFSRELQQLYRCSGRIPPVICKTSLLRSGSTCGLVYLAREQYFQSLCQK